MQMAKVGHVTDRQKKGETDRRIERQGKGYLHLLRTFFQYNRRSNIPKINQNSFGLIKIVHCMIQLDYNTCIIH